MTTPPAAATLYAYQHDWHDWCAWCEPQGIDPVHCSVDDLARCLRAWHAAGLAWSSISRRRSAISYYQRQAGIEHPAANDYKLRTVMSEIRRSTPPQRGKLPLSEKDLERILRNCEADPKPLRGLRDRAIVAVMWSCCLRRSRLAALRVAELSGRRRLPNLSDEARRMTIEWLQAAQISEGPVFRSVRLDGKVGLQLRGDDIAKITKRRCSAIGKAVALFSASSVRSGRVAHEVRRGTGVRKIMSIAKVRSVDIVARRAGMTAVR